MSYDAWKTETDLDHNSEPWNRPEPCATRGCEGECDIPAMSAFCYYCRTAALVEQAREADRKVRGAA